jgi:hypothetical protein
MKQTSELEKILTNYFAWNKARINCFAGMLLSVIAVRTVNLSEMAVGFGSKVQIASRYRRLQRFFAAYDLDMEEIACFIFSLFFINDKKLYLTIDRTNWRWGKGKINILTLGVAYEGLSIPLFWKLLNKSGNAKSKEHVEILEKFIKTFGKRRIAGVLADREFASGEFFERLNTEQIPFYIRIKDNTQIRVLKSKPWHAKKLFKELNPKQSSTYVNFVTIYGQKGLRLAGSRSERGELMLVATNQNTKNAVPIYIRRWEIENLFQCLKTRGFRFEDTHITISERIEKLMALVSMAFCWAHKIGEWRAIKKPIILKKFRNSRRPQYSYFRYGLDFIREIILHINKKYRQFRLCLEQLILPDIPEIISIREAKS